MSKRILFLIALLPFLLVACSSSAAEQPVVDPAKPVIEVFRAPT